VEEFQGLLGHLVDNIQPFLTTHGYWIIAVIIFLENAGIPLPGETILIICGALAGQGKLDLTWVLVAAISGAILGDNAGYLIGRRFGRTLVLKYGKVFGLTEAKFEVAEQSFLKNSAWAVFFGRFVLLLRILAGPLAGIINMPWPKFFLFNALGAISWASAIGLASFYFGKQVEQFFQSLGVWALVITLVAIVAYSVTREYFGEKKLEQQIEAEKNAKKDS